MTRRCAALVLCALVLFASPAPAHHAPGELKVAAILSLSGSHAYMGRAELNAIELGIGEINAQGGIQGHQFELLSFDDQGDPRKAGEIAARLTGANAPDLVIGGTSTDSSIAIARAIERLRVPFFALGGSGQILSFGRRWVFKTVPNEAAVVAAILADAARRGMKQVALISEDNEFGRGGRREVRQMTDPQSIAFRKYGIRLAADATFRSDGSDATRNLDRLRSLPPRQAIVVFGSGEAPAAILKTLRSADIAAAIYLTHRVVSSEFLSIAGAAAEGVRFPGSGLPVSSSLPENHPGRDALLRFIEAYRARYGAAPSMFAGYAYDALMLAAEAIRRSPFTDAEWIRTPLETIRDHAGVSGVYTLWPDDHAGLDDKSLLMLEICDGAWKMAE
ncbi:MAG: ABC transporter substrate-binding protein [Rhodocyclaceae bacterium]|nr:ABC transporter substrate-binding protein [Rhodocyclaceae bacterium]